MSSSRYISKSNQMSSNQSGFRSSLSFLLPNPLVLIDEVLHLNFLLAASTIVMYSVFVVDSATTFYNLATRRFPLQPYSFCGRQCQWIVLCKKLVHFYSCNHIPLEKYVKQCKLQRELGTPKNCASNKYGAHANAILQENLQWPLRTTQGITCMMKFVEVHFSPS